MGHVYRGRAFELVDVSLARHPGVALPTALREDEVQGAKLDTTRPWQRGNPTVDEMTRFLRTRDVHGVHDQVREDATADPDDPRPPKRSAATWEDLAKLCTAIIKREKAARAEGREVFVRDPDGGTLMRRLPAGFHWIFSWFVLSDKVRFGYVWPLPANAFTLRMVTHT